MILIHLLIEFLTEFLYEKLIAFAGLLTIAFVVLKLCGVISWGWLWVLSPLWITACVGVVIAIVWWIL